jgi:hypothetical protein
MRRDRNTIILPVDNDAISVDFLCLCLLLDWCNCDRRRVLGPDREQYNEGLGVNLERDVDC